MGEIDSIVVGRGSLRSKGRVRMCGVAGERQAPSLRSGGSPYNGKGMVGRLALRRGGDGREARPTTGRGMVGRLALPRVLINREEGV